MSWLREAFSENGQGSFARLASGFHTFAVIAWGTTVVAHTHTMIDPATMVGMAAFATAPYASGKISSAISTFSPNAPNGK